MKDETPFTQEQLDAMLEGLERGATVGDVINLNPEAIESGYSLAYSLYTAGNYKDAETMFRALCVYDHTDQRFWMGLGGCRQMNGDLQGAIDAYGFGAYTSAFGDPAPLVHGALCCLKLGEKEDAKGLFTAALGLGEAGNSEHAVYHERARAMLDMLEKGE